MWIFIKDIEGNPAIFDAEQAIKEGTFKAPWYEPILWIGSLYVLSIIIGFIPAIILFFIVFLTLKANTSWVQTALLTAGGIGLLLTFGYFLNLEFPHSGKYCYGKTPWDTFIQSKYLALDKQLDRQLAPYPQLSWCDGEAHSIGKTLLSRKNEGLAIEEDSMGEPFQDNI